MQTEANSNLHIDISEVNVKGQRSSRWPSLSFRDPKNRLMVAYISIHTYHKVNFMACQWNEFPENVPKLLKVSQTFEKYALKFPSYRKCLQLSHGLIYDARLHLLYNVYCVSQKDKFIAFLDWKEFNGTRTNTGGMNFVDVIIFITAVPTGFI